MGRNQDPILAPLNAPQREAVLTIDGPMLVLAGAGSGKTRVITHRIAWMLSQGIPPSAILGLTFTKKAAAEMRHRVFQLTGRSGVRLSTFHAFCAVFLREEFPAIGREPDFSIYDEGDSLTLVRQVIDSLSLDAEHLKPAAVKDQISAWKNAFILPESALEECTGTMEQDKARIYEAYDRRLREANACDFDDLLVRTVRILNEDEAVGARWQERITHVVVDEFQDTNSVQYAILRALTKARGNLAVTGDQDQAIYSWRGADTGNFDRFLRDHPEAPIVKLEQNYRSTRAILTAASDLIEKNRRRIPKRLWGEQGEGNPVVVSAYGDDYEEAMDLADRVKKSIKSGTPEREIAILFRTNSLSLPIERCLLQSNVSYRVVGGLEFFARQEVKDFMAWLRFLVNPSDTVSLHRLLDAPPRGIGATTRAKIEGLARSSGRPIGAILRDRTVLETLDNRSRKALNAFADLLVELDRYLHEATPRPLGIQVLHFLKETGFEQHWRTKAEKGGSLDPWQNLGQFVNLATEFDRRGQTTLAEFLTEIALLTDIEEETEREERISLMTIHAAKGLEFDVVFVAGVDRGIIPHAMSRMSGEGEEEERRLLHVAMTRARKDLTLTFATRRTRFGAVVTTGPSPFLDEFVGENVQHVGHSYATTNARWQSDDLSGDSQDGGGQDDSEWARVRRGTAVWHPTFGRGRVAGVRGHGAALDRKVVVDFEDAGQKTLILRHARLEILESEDG